MFNLYLLIFLIAVAVVTTVVLGRRRRSIWTRFAARHGLEQDNTYDGLRLTGDINGGCCILKTADDSSDTGAMGVEEVVMQLSFDPSTMPEDLRIESVIGLVGDLQSSMARQRITTGDDTFDRDLLATCQSESVAGQWLTPERRSALLSVAQSHHDKQMICEPGRLSLQTRTAVSRLNHLEAMLSSLQNCVKQLR